MSSSVNGSAKKKRNRRKLNKTKAEGVAASGGGDVFDDGVSSQGQGDEERVMKSLLAALSGSSSTTGQAQWMEKEVFVGEVMWLMKSEGFVEELWKGYLEG
jgi:hypothetical protein